VTFSRVFGTISDFLNPAPSAPRQCCESLRVAAGRRRHRRTAGLRRGLYAWSGPVAGPPGGRTSGRSSTTPVPTGEGPFEPADDRARHYHPVHAMGHAPALPAAPTARRGRGVARARAAAGPRGARPLHERRPSEPARRPRHRSPAARARLPPVGEPGRWKVLTETLMASWSTPPGAGPSVHPASSPAGSTIPLANSGPAKRWPALRPGRDRAGPGGPEWYRSLHHDWRPGRQRTPCGGDGRLRRQHRRRRQASAAHSRAGIAACPRATNRPLPDRHGGEAIDCSSPLRGPDGPPRERAQPKSRSDRRHPLDPVPVAGPPGTQTRMPRPR